MKKIKCIFSKIIIAVMAMVIILPSATYAATSNLPMADVGDYGNWATPDNIDLFKTDITHDMEQFQPEPIVSDYVPFEAKIGLAMMNGFSIVADVLDSSLVRFAIIFMVIAYIFWSIFEAYNMMKNGSSAMDFGVNLVKKGGVILIWIIILNFGPAQVFMWIMGPIISVGTYMSNLILNAIAGAIGTELPDTCAAIRDYAAANTSGNMLIDANAAADILCVPTRLSGFFTTAVVAGWKWMIAGIGTSAFTVLVGATFIVIFLYTGFKFLLMGLGVIMDLFLSVLMLPFIYLMDF